MEDNNLIDYKFFCFNGVVKCLYVSNTQKHQMQFYDESFSELDIEREDYSRFGVLPSKPPHFYQMKLLAEKLSKGIPHLRVDFYDVNGRVYFGEMTFYTGSGFIPFKSQEWDVTLGNWVELPQA